MSCLSFTPGSSFCWKHGLTVHVVRSLRARRYLLRLHPDGSARLVIPRRGSQTEAREFLERSEDWLLRRRAPGPRRPPARPPWQDGSSLLLRGEEVLLRVTPHAAGVSLAFAGQRINLPAALPDYHETILCHLRVLATKELPLRTQELARLHGVTIHRISVRAQRTRWGSCSARGTISLNWRVIQAPPWVRDYLIVHELMHRREMNHSPRFWHQVAASFPLYREAERWLKKTRLEDLN